VVRLGRLLGVVELAAGLRRLWGVIELAERLGPLLGVVELAAGLRPLLGNRGGRVVVCAAVGMAGYHQFQ